MDGTRSTSPKRRRDTTNDDYDDDAPPRKRSASRTPPPTASPSYRLAERPLTRRYSREESEDSRRRYHYNTRRTSNSRSRSPTSRSRSHSSASTPPPKKPTQLHYKPSLILHGHKKPISALRFSPDGQYIASGSSDCTIKLWDAHTGTLEHTLEGHLAGISTLSWSFDSRILASGSDDKSIRLWDVKRGLPHPTPFIGHHNYVYSIAFSPKGNMLVSGSYDEAVYLWDVRAARVMRSLPAHSDPVSGVDFVRDGTLIVSCSHDGLIRVWDTATGQCLRTLVHEDNAPVSSVKFSPNGRYVLAWTLDSCVRLWNYIEGKGKCVKTYQGHVNKNFSLSGAFGTYGTKSTRGGHHHADQEFAFIASGSEDGSVILWDVSSKNVLQRLEGHIDAVLAVDTHPTERIIASAGLDRTVRVWRADYEGAAAVRDEEGVNGSSKDAGKHDDEEKETETEAETTGYDPDTLPPNPFAEG
ncbi:WD domain protein [Neocucurbitaria cava]|uniref:WD domain protein n=1 Tax=Neocucurbitaria cava TaxID=798079 RepID=A0A9W8YER6_9PLEO|nr:WD domain protein [Neocucurbitaria cava]